MNTRIAPRNHQITGEGTERRIKCKKRRKKQRKYILNGNKHILNNNNFSQWTRHIKKKTQDGWLDKSASAIYIMLKKESFQT